MKYFLDSARIEEIAYAYEHWGIDGVTTNPKHVQSAGKPFVAVMDELAREFDGVEFPISVEIDPHLSSSAEMADAARRMAARSPNFVIKLPCTEQGLVAAHALSRDGIRTNVTLVFSASQALQAGRIGATFVSPFVGWKEASGEDYRSLVREVAEIYARYSFDTQIITAAVRHGRHIVEAALAGSHIVTAGYEVYRDSFHHPHTTRGLEIFADAWDATDTAGV